MSDDVKFAMSQMGAKPDRFSGVSARKGGLSTAIEVGIHEAMLFLQTGQEMDIPGIFLVCRVNLG